MMLTTKGRYAVMAMVDIAANNGILYPISLEKISERQDITVSYLEQIFTKLRKNGLVISIKGPGGGYKLCQDAHLITIATIINAVEESIQMTKCTMLEQPGCIYNKTKCLTHDLWDGLTKHIYNYLNNVTLADICNKKINLSLAS
jgi:Rrf2 family iron-sulfur cluster assembly transcriptional regulator